MARAPSDDCRPLALEAAASQTRRPPRASRRFDFSDGTLILTEAGSKRRASLHVLRGEEALEAINPGGIEIFSTDLDGFRAALTHENRTLKRALTDPRLVSGIGNAYSDEILHAAQLSPITQTHKLKPEEWERLFAATRSTLTLWIDRLRAEAEKSFPEKVTAFRPELAVHGSSANPARAAASRCSAFATPTTKPTTAPAARPAERSSLTAVFPACSAQTGHARSKNSKPSNAAEIVPSDSSLFSVINPYHPPITIGS